MRGKATAVVQRANNAKQKPNPFPNVIRIQPRGVEMTSHKNSKIEIGYSFPYNKVYKKFAVNIQAQKRPTSIRPSIKIAGIAGDFMTLKTVAHEVSRPFSNLRLTSYRNSATKGPSKAKPVSIGNNNCIVFWSEAQKYKTKPIKG
jgi:hypothetical protein